MAATMKWETLQRFRLTESPFLILILMSDLFPLMLGKETASAGGILWDAQALLTPSLQCSCAPALKGRSYGKISWKGDEGEPGGFYQGWACIRANLGSPFQHKDNHFSYSQWQGCT